MPPTKSDDDVIPVVVNVSPPSNEQYKASLVIVGITCASCVSIIEKTIKSLPSVVADSVFVNLLTGDTRFIFTDSSLTSSVIRDTVESLGYDVESVSVSQQEFRHMSFAPSVFSKVSKPQYDNVVDLSPVTTRLAITGMTCASCVKVVQDTLQNLPGVLTATVNLLLNEASIEHDSQLTGPRDLIDAVENVGYEAKLIVAQTNRNLVQERARKQTELLKKRFLLSLVAAIPTFIISMIIMMWLPDDHPIKMKFLAQIVPGLDVATVILFVIATPVQFYLGAPFYKKAYRSLRYARVANMETLVAIGTSVAYFGSIATVMIAVSGKRENSKDSFFETSVFLITFIWLGKLMETMAKGKTFESVTKLMELQPEKATLVDEDDEESETEIDVELIQVNDILKVNAGAKFPCDGVIIRGVATIDESMLTGEPIPVVKSVEDQVFSATLNLSSTAWIQATHVGTDTTLARIITLIQEAQASKKAPIEVLADTISQYFVPTVILIATIDFLIWFILGANNAFPKEWIPDNQSYPVFALFFGISVLVIACPCAMGLASPTAIMVGTGVAAKFGILIKGGGEAIQMASRINTMVFDKTGTLTRGRPAVVNCRLFINCAHRDRDKLQQRKLILQIIGLVESASNHPLALAVCQMTARKLLEVAETDDDVVLDVVTEVPGKGLQATVNVTSPLSSTLLPCRASVQAQTTKYNVCIGSYEWVESMGFCYPPGLSKECTTNQIKEWREQGQSIVAVGVTMVDNAGGLSASLIIAQFGIADTIRADAAHTVNILKGMGIDIWMITGDHATTANTVAKQLNIDNVIAQVTPENKAEKVKWLQRRIRVIESSRNMREKTKELANDSREDDSYKTDDSKRPVVAMIGDGINDSPALAQADLGISIASGTDIAIESASVILARSTLMSLVTMIQLSRAIIRRIRINFMWAFLYNTVVIPIAAGVFFPIYKKSLPPELAGLAMVCSSVSVVLSSLLLRRFKEKTIYI